MGIGGHYQIGKELGAGGMGTVYRGTDTRTDTPVAIKQLKTEIATPETIERFRREGEALRELNHPNIVKMLDTFQHEGQHYLVMEFVSGGDLKDLIDGDDSLDIQQIVNMAIDLADALTRAHRLNIIHRDLKPANVLIGEDGVLRLTDFGVAHVGSKERVTDTDAIVGTIDYLPPEAFDGSFDARGDIWAFGVMLFEMLAGKRPFTGDTIIETLQAITTKPIPDLEALCPSAPVALVDLVYRMLEGDPQARISSVRHVGAQLEDILHERVTESQIQEPRFETPTPITVNLSVIKHNLPAQPTAFVGREHEIGEMTRLIQDDGVRLLTIVAPGGMGKTRLALATAEAHLESYPDGVFLVELAPLSDGTHIHTAIAEAVGYPFQPDSRSPQQQILDFLRDKQVLLIMDNFEHLADSVNIVADILQTAREVNIIATSREKLNLSGETVFLLEGLDVPDNVTHESVFGYSGVQLFTQQARRMQADFELSADNLPDVIRICRMVNGLPLGIVLASSWLEMLSVTEIADEIEGSIDFLETSLRDIPERQRSMRAVFDYSWNLLNETERDIFMTLSIFRGGFTREAVQNITGASLRTLMSLLHKSLITRDADSGRYHIHELTRQYAQSKLEDSGQYKQVADAHSEYYLKLLSQFNYERIFHEQIKVTTFIESDYDNVMLAVEQALTSKRNDLIEGILAPLGIYFFTNNQFEGIDIFDEIETNLRVEGATKQPLIYWLAIRHRLRFYHFVANPQETLATAKEAISALEQYDDFDSVAYLMSIVSRMYMWLGDLNQALTYAHDGVALARKHTTEWSALEGLPNLAYVIHLQGDTEQAIKLQSQLIESINNFGSSSLLMALAYLNMGEFQHALNNTAEAKRYFEQSLEQATIAKHYRTMAYALTNLGNITHYEGNYDKAITYNQQSLTMFRDIGDRRGQADAHVRLSDALRYIKQIDAATNHLHLAIALYEEIGDKRGLGNAYAILGNVTNLSGNFELQEQYWNLSLEYRRQVNNPNELADSISSLALIKAVRGNANEGLQLLVEAENLIAQEKIEDPLTIGRITGFRIIAYLMTERFQEAYDLSKESLESPIHSNPWSFIQMHSAVGASAFGLEKYDEAQTHFIEGLHIALEIGALDSGLPIFVGLSSLMHRLHQMTEQAVAHLLFIERVWGKSGPVFVNLSNVRFNEMKDLLSPEQLAQAEAESQTLTLEDIAQELLDIFEDTD